MIFANVFQSQVSAAVERSDRTSEGICDTEELNFQFDDYGGKKYHFSEPPAK